MILSDVDVWGRPFRNFHVYDLVVYLQQTFEIILLILSTIGRKWNIVSNRIYTNVINSRVALFVCLLRLHGSTLAPILIKFALEELSFLR